jgi:ABC-type branched-subunit amino acid transport system ATPase component/branched-subunit amino acid ABC-type transport system permease component
MLLFIIAGLTTGSVYSLAGVGLVLTYKTSGVFNFAHGALATVSAYLFYTLHVQHGMPWPLAAVISVFVVGAVCGLLLELVARRLNGTTLAIRVAATVGILLIVQGVAVIIYGTVITRTVPQFLPTHPFTIAGTVLTSDRVIVFAIGLVATVALYIYFRTARMGVAMRAVVDNTDLVDISGTSPTAVRRLAWVIGTTFAAASGLLLVPFITLDATTLTFLVVAAFGAAALGRFSNLPVTYLGGLLIGVGASLATKYFTTGWASGISASLPFLALFAVLLVTPRSRLVERLRVAPRRVAAWTMPWQIQGAFGVVLLAVLIMVPGFAGIYLSGYIEFLAFTIVLLSLGLLVRTSGQVSLCHATFMAIGVSAFSHLAFNDHWPWFAALLAAGLVTIPIGALLSIPAIRLSGLYLALATFGFGLLVQYMFYTENYMFGSIGAPLNVPLPMQSFLGLTGSLKSYYYLCLLITVVIALAMVAVNRSRLGRLLRALADSPVGLATSGSSTNVTRVVVFCLSAFLAAIAGVLGAGAFSAVGADSYQPVLSLTLFTVVVIMIGGAPWYAFVGAAGLEILPSYLTSTNVTNWLQVVFGASAVLFAITPPEARELPQGVRDFFDKLVRRRPPSARRALGDDGPMAPQRVERATVEARDIRVAFGGLIAVDGAAVLAQTGQIVGLIGPNGAGKTTMFNVCSGLNRNAKGSVVLDGTDITRRSAASRARHGLGRTFQQMELFDSLTVLENVALGAEARFAGANALRHLVSSPGTKRRVHGSAVEAMRECDLLELADRTVGSLSTGQRRLVELARCLAGSYRILLLDEPSSGLDRTETARFGEILQRAVQQRGVGIFIVEHDMGLVSSICDYIYVLDFGKPILDGRPREVLSSAVVREAYLGSSIEDLGLAASAAGEIETEVQA